MDAQIDFPCHKRRRERCNRGALTDNKVRVRLERIGIVCWELQVDHTRPCDLLLIALTTLS